MARCSVAIVAGTGCRALLRGLPREELRIRTGLGAVEVWLAHYGGISFAILHRHGPDHTVPPHRIPHVRHMLALQSLGVRRILAINAVGSLRADLPVGTLVALSDFVALQSTGVPSSAEPSSVSHADVSDAYCPTVRSVLIETMSHRHDFIPQGVLFGVAGPRYETPSEVRLYARLGGDVVGMTGVGEAIAAREAGICYAALACVTNLGVGLSEQPLEHGAVSQTMARLIHGIRDELMHAVCVLDQRTRPEGAGGKPECRCAGGHSTGGVSSPTSALNS